MRRTFLMTAGVAAGLAISLVAWWSAGGGAANSDRVSATAAELQRARVQTVSHLAKSATRVADLRASPLFLSTVGPGAVREPSMRLDGVSLSRRRVAALLSIDGRAATWVLAGETREGVTLQEVRADRVVVETVLGFKDLALGEQTSASGPASVAGPDVLETGDVPPPGVRMPPAPASAPR